MTFALRTLLTLVFCLVSADITAAGKPFQYHWDIRQLAAADADRIELRTRNNRLLETLSGSQMRILHSVKESIERVAEIETRLLIVDGDQPNAFAGKEKGSGNIIGINFAMLHIIGFDVHAAAALIGHEIAHLKLGHGDQQRKSGVGSAILKAAGGVALTGLGVPMGHTISNLTFTAMETEYSRDHEREADYLGAIWAVEAGYEADGAVRLHKRMQQGTSGRPSPFLSTHPSGPERIRTLENLAERLAPDP